MKKNILIKALYIFCVAFFTACSSDSNDSIPDVNPETKPILIKKITETLYYSGTSDTDVTDFTYENSVLKSITYNSTYKTELVYDGDKVMKANYFKNGIADGFTTFYYNGDLLNYTLSGKNQDEKTEYFYTNSILASKKSGYFNGLNYIVQQNSVYSFNSAKNITQSIDTRSFYGPEITSKQIYSYDTKNHPMKYMNKYYRLVYQGEGFDGLNTNNIISRGTYSPITNTVPTYGYNEIVYDSNNFPIEIKEFSASDNTLISKTTIEYQ